MLRNNETLNAKVTLKFENGGTIPIDAFDKNSDIFNVAQKEVGDYDISPDGIVYGHRKREMTITTINLLGVSKAGATLVSMVNADLKSTVSNPMLNNLTVIVENNGIIRTFSKGGITKITPSESLGSQELISNAIEFKFGEVK